MSNKDLKYWNSFKTRLNPFGDVDIVAENYLRAQKVGRYFLYAYIGRYPFLQYFFTGIIGYTLAAMLSWWGLLVILGCSFLWLPEHRRIVNMASNKIGNKYIEAIDAYERLCVGYDELLQRLGEAEKTIEQMSTKTSA